MLVVVCAYVRVCAAVGLPSREHVCALLYFVCRCAPELTSVCPHGHMQASSRTFACLCFILWWVCVAARPAAVANNV